MARQSLTSTRLPGRTRAVPSADSLAIWLPTAAAAAVASVFGTIGADGRWLAALGAYIVHRGSIPGFVPYATAPSHGWHDAPVLGQIVFHALDAVGGERGLLVGQVVGVTLAFAVLGYGMRRLGAGAGAVLLMLLFMIPSAFVALPIIRAQLFSVALFPVLLFLLREEAHRASRRIWLVPPLLAVWANLHGAVLVGLGVAGIYLMVERLRLELIRTVVVGAACIVAVFATPQLWNTGSYYSGVLRNEAARRGLGQWAPLSVTSPFDVTFIVCGLVLAFLALRARPTLWELVALVALAVLAGRTSRGGVWFAFLAVGLAAQTLRSERAPRKQLSVPLAALLAGLVLLGLIRGPHASGADRTLLHRALARAAGTPILATEVLGEQAALAGGRIWVGNPIDAYDRKDQGLFLDWLQGKPSGDAALAHAPRVALVRPGSKPQRRLAGNHRFRAVGRDENAVLYFRATR